MVLVLLRRPGTKVNRMGIKQYLSPDINIIVVKIQQICEVALAQLQNYFVNVEVQIPAEKIIIFFGRFFLSIFFFFFFFLN